jgi:hypothetical protein
MIGGLSWAWVTSDRSSGQGRAEASRRSGWPGGQVPRLPHGLVARGQSTTLVGWSRPAWPRFPGDGRHPSTPPHQSKEPFASCASKTSAPRYPGPSVHPPLSMTPARRLKAVNRFSARVSVVAVAHCQRRHARLRVVVTDCRLGSLATARKGALAGDGTPRWSRSGRFRRRPSLWLERAGGRLIDPLPALRPGCCSVPAGPA